MRRRTSPASRSAEAVPPDPPCHGRTEPGLLGHLKTALGIEFQHHDAGEDARAAAIVVLKAETHTGKKFEELLSPAPARPATPAGRTAPARKPRQSPEMPDPAPHLESLERLIGFLDERAPLIAADHGRMRAAQLEAIMSKGAAAVPGDDAIPVLSMSREERRAAENDLGVHVDNLMVQCEGYFRTGQFPAPHSAMRIAIILSRARIADRERAFLAAWCRNFGQGGNGRTYGELVRRAEKRGVAPGASET